jgi:hypothetical protein
VLLGACVKNALGEITLTADPSFLTWWANLPSPAPYIIVRNVESVTPWWIYLIPVIGGAATIFAAYVAVNGAMRSASRQVQGILRSQRFVDRAQRARLREDAQRQNRAIRRQVFGLLFECVGVLALEAEWPGFGDESSGNLQSDRAIRRFVDRVYDLDVVAAFSDLQIEMLHGLARTLIVMLTHATTLWKAEPANIRSDQRTRLADACVNVLGLVATAFDYLGETEKAELTRTQSASLEAKRNESKASDAPA